MTFKEGIKMLSLFIVEDNYTQRERMEKTLKEYIDKEGLEAEFKLITGDPFECLDYLGENQGIRGLYFLDIDLNNEIDGIELGRRIKEKDPNGRLVIVTTKGTMAFFTFLFKLEVLDYIVKESAEEVLIKMKRCLEIAYKRYMKGGSAPKKELNLKVGSGIRSVSLDEVCFIEPSKREHNLLLYTLTGKIEFRGHMQKIEAENPTLVRAHRACLVNMDNAKSFDEQQKKLEMINGEFCDVAVRKICKIKRILERKEELNW